MLRSNEKRTKWTLLFVLALKVLICAGNKSAPKAKVTEVGNFKPIVSSTPPAIKLTAANAMNVAAPKDGLSKRNIKFSDLSGSSDTVAGKSYDPPPEYYRGPTSAQSKYAAAHSNRDSAASFVSKPVSFPDASGRNKYGENAGEHNSWQLLRGGSTQGHQSGSQDRISVGHYGGGTDHSTTHGGSASSFLHGSGISPGYVGYVPDKRPYDSYHHPHSGGGGGGIGGVQYPVSTHEHDGGYYESSETNGIPFDVYGSRGHYDGAGGDYSYSTYPAEVHETVRHKGHGVDWQHKALLAKSFLIPLASAAVLGIAAALVSNPLLLQLGTVSGPTLIGKRRKRRDLNSTSSESALAYRAHRPGHLARATASD